MRLCLIPSHQDLNLRRSPTLPPYQAFVSPSLLLPFCFSCLELREAEKSSNPSRGKQITQVTVIQSLRRTVSISLFNVYINMWGLFHSWLCSFLPLKLWRNILLCLFFLSFFFFQSHFQISVNKCKYNKSISLKGHFNFKHGVQSPHYVECDSVFRSVVKHKQLPHPFSKPWTVHCSHIINSWL